MIINRIVVFAEPARTAGPLSGRATPSLREAPHRQNWQTIHLSFAGNCSNESGQLPTLAPN